VYILEPMTQEDVEEVSGVERLCFTNPWPISAYRRELRNPNQNYYIVLRDDPQADDEEQPLVSIETRQRDQRKPPRFAFWPLGHRSEKRTPPPIIGFAGMWVLLDEAHVTTIGVRPDYQGRGLGELLFLELIDEAIRRMSTWVTLEVRVTNYSAQELYKKYDFSIQGRRPRYYSDNNEDAFIMWSESFRDPAYRKRIDANRRRLQHKMSFVHDTGNTGGF
jgi:ribosomal-protein-alanine N-acetyltransferase